MEFTGDAAYLHLSVIYEFNMHLQVIERDSGTYFDVLSSAGGLKDGLVPLLRLVVSCLNYNVFSVYMISKLIKRYQTSNDKVD